MATNHTYDAADYDAVEHLLPTADPDPHNPEFLSWYESYDELHAIHVPTRRKFIVNWDIGPCWGEPGLYAWPRKIRDHSRNYHTLDTTTYEHWRGNRFGDPDLLVDDALFVILDYLEKEQKGVPID